MPERKKVRVLREDVARRIAAGEVIDKPAAIVRELMDNAVDCGADEIRVEIEQGGIERACVCDNGAGFSRDDLENCAKPHATSKITEAEDLDRLETLGFRGEALASIAAVSELRITSGNLKMSVSILNGRKIEDSPIFQNGIGARVESIRLFSDIPARRRFLKKPASETNQCKEIFVEKSLARPNIAFKFTADGQTKMNLPKAKTFAERFSDATGIENRLLNEIQGGGFENDGKSRWNFSLVLGDPSIRRNDRRQIFIFVNGRKVNEFSLVQAIEFGCQGFFPNGTHPVAALFAEVSPYLVDFNIHPAKREVKFKDISALHKGVSSSVRNFLSSVSNLSVLNQNKIEKKDSEIETPIYKIERDFGENFSKNFDFGKKSEKNFSRKRFFSFDSKKSNDIEKTQNFFTDFEKSLEKSFPQKESKIDLKDFRYIGRAMETFIIVQCGETLFFIDQHAAHERLIFNDLMNRKETQNLLIPLEFEADSADEENCVKNALSELDEAGFSGRFENGIFKFFTVPSDWQGSEEELAEALHSLDEPKRILYNIFARAACRKAVMAGTFLDDKTAEKIAKDALALPDPHCPHGRPIWFTLSKQTLYAKVRRTE